MFPLKAIIKAAPAVSRVALQTRTTVIAGPARNKLSFAEKAAHGALIVVGVCFIPAWVLVHIKDYQSRE